MASTRPPPISANATYLNEQNNRYRKFARPYDSKQSRTDKFGHKIGINIKNQHTLQESNMDCNDINTINLDQYMSEKKQQRQVIIEIISQYSDKDLSNTIMAFCGDKIVLIPNTFDRYEFLKHWFVVDKGTQINEHRDDHRVDLHSNYVQLIRRGAIASCKGYKPSKTAKLKLECRFIYHNKRDHMTFGLQSKGMRDIHTDRAWSGEIFAQDQIMVYNQIGKQRSDKIWIKTRDEKFSMEKTLSIPSPLLHKELCITIISDGVLCVYYQCNVYLLFATEIDRDRNYFMMYYYFILAQVAIFDRVKFYTDGE